VCGEVLICAKNQQFATHIIREWIHFVRRHDIRQHAVFLIDHDMLLAERIVEGVDVWINTPRRPWEASGTSGMKVLKNGGVNLSDRLRQAQTRRYDARHGRGLRSSFRD
jgi:glucan phosphorylase